VTARKIAFVHDWLTGMRGGEKVLEAACELFPDAEIYTLIHRPERVSDLINSRRIRVSWLDSLPGARRYYRYLLPLMPLAVRGFDLSGYDLVVSFNHCVAKGARTSSRRGGRPPVHVCYCHTPMRYVYDQFDDYFADGFRGGLRLGAALLRPFLVRWDRATSDGVDHFVANSENVRGRIRAAYGRDASVIRPAADTGFFTPAAAGRPDEAPYYLIAGALVPYKRVDLAIAACRRLGARLKVVGVGTERSRLEALAKGAPVEFLGWQSDESLRELYRGCEAFLFPANEDFGIAPVEAMGCGRPVIAFKKGGALETVVDGVTGVFFEEQTPESLAAAIERARRMRFDPDAIRARAVEFDKSRFSERFARFVDDAWERRGRVRVMEVVECGGPGGTGYQVAAICNGLDKSRFETELVYAVRPGGTPAEYEALARGAERFFHVPEMVRPISPWSDLRAFARLYRLFKARRPDVVHAHSSKAGFLARLAAWAAGVPAVHYSPRGYSFLQTDSSAPMRAFYRLLERLASRFGGIVAVSDAEAELARGLGVADVRVVRDAYLGEPASPERPERPARELVVCAAARLSFARNPESFVRLARGLAGAHPGARCVWIGDGELREPVEALIRELGLSDRLEVTGWVPHAEALRRLARADVFVHYSRWDAIPNAVLEAMAHGVPVVASDIPANRALVRSGAGLLARSEEELLDATRRLLGDPALRARLGAAGRAVVDAEYSRGRLIREISALYASGAAPAR